MKKLLVAVLLLAAVAAGGYSYYRYSKRPTPPTVTTAAVTRGDIVESVSATGTLQAVTTVQVGSQVSGNIAFLGADFNSIVKKGQVLARLDPSLFEAQAQQQRANLAQARANYQRSLSDLERTKVQLTDAQQKYNRATELSARNLLPKSDLDSAKTALDTAQAAVQSQQATVTQTQASITQAEASVNQTQVNLEHTVITSPIDGLVISRSVDVGQTVAASMQAPTLFVLAADLTKMQVLANLDESDVGRIRPNQTVTFRVDAYPTQTFHGTVSQVRLEPKVQQNVVTYATVIDVPNDDLRLKPGMTANVDVEISRASNVLRIPNSALRFRPSNDVFTALGQTPPESPRRGGFVGGGGPGRGSAPDTAGTSASGVANAGAATGVAATGRSEANSLSQPSAGRQAQRDAGAAGTAPGAGAGGGAGAAGGEGSTLQAPQNNAGRGGPGTANAAGTQADAQNGTGQSGDERRNRFAERLQNMSPEERDAATARMRERGIDPSSPGFGSGRGGGGGRNGQGSADGSGGARFGRGGNAGAGAADAPTNARFGRGAAPSSGGDAAPGNASRNAAAASGGNRRTTPAQTGTGGAVTIDALFAPLVRPTSRGMVWLFAENKLERVPLVLGISDGQNTELIDGNITEGTEIVTNVTIAGQTTRPATTAFPGFGGPGGRQGFPGGGGFGGGGGRNGR